MHYLVLGYIFYIVVNGAVSNDVRDHTIYTCLENDAILCSGVESERWCCKKNAICGTQHNICSEPYDPPSSIIVVIAIGLSIALALLLCGVIHYLRECRRKQQTRHHSQSTSTYIPLSDTSAAAISSAPYPLQTISATVNNASA